MKTLLKNTIWLLLIALTSCDDEKKEPQKFDLSTADLSQYFIFSKVKYNAGITKNEVRLFDFEPGEKVKTITLSKIGNSNYTVVDNNTLKINSPNILLTFNEKGEVTTTNLVVDDYTYEEFHLIKKAENNQLSGKTFSGTYYIGDGSVLHQSFFYQFDAGSMKVGTNFPKADREGSYTNIGNLAAYNDKIAGLSNDREIMFLHEGKLHVSYHDYRNFKIYYGTFNEQK
ncbi:hypothetical protein [Leadbetterella byssophila]|uniref:hypothetical protein n=1 Tax=Leadbetterella byssophila TaxID=316068 RepID=UPI0039A0809C